MKKTSFIKLCFSPDIKAKIAASVSIFLVIFAVFILFNKKESPTIASKSRYYEQVKEYMQSEYTAAYGDYFDVMYVEELSDYQEKISSDGKRIEATFLMKAHYRYPYRDPDTVSKVIEAREKGDMTEYKKLYDECNQMQSAEYLLKITADLSENGTDLKNTEIYSGIDGGWILLKNGLSDYIIEE